MKNDKKRIYVSGPSITQKEIEYVTKAVSTAWYDNANDFNKQFEEQFAKYVGRNYAIALPSCTSALHLSLVALGVKEGDEVIVPDMTWIATSAPISYVGATPIFVDVDKENWCMDAVSLKRSITSKTKAIITVDIYGNMPEYDDILKIAEEHDIPVIEDAAEAMGCSYKGKKAGSFGIISAFSFHGSKIMTTGEGGMLVTDCKTIHEHCLMMRDHGRNISDDRMFWNIEIGYKYKMSSMQAALGLAQLERIEELVLKKQQIFHWYYEELKDIKGIQLNNVKPYVVSNYWMVTVVADPAVYRIDKDKMIHMFKEHNMDTRPIFYPLSKLPAYEKLNGVTNTVVDGIYPYGVNLPSDINITHNEVNTVCSCLKEMLHETSVFE